ncbi:hypothetical protein YC2023_056721 [Brassica napus]
MWTASGPFSLSYGFVYEVSGRWIILAVVYLLVPPACLMLSDVSDEAWLCGGFVGLLSRCKVGVKKCVQAVSEGCLDCEAISLVGGDGIVWQAIGGSDRSGLRRRDGVFGFYKWMVSCGVPSAVAIYPDSCYLLFS